ncbi:hypothetical protein KBA27_01990 [bacterium]|nr:hypothetical protein [bacterium]
MAFIIGVKLGNRVNCSAEFQKVLTEYGCIIKTRLGLHDVSNNQCSPQGVILLEVTDKEEGKKFVEALEKIEFANVQTMEF